MIGSMCLGITGRLVELIPDRPDLAQVAVAGVVRTINIALLDRAELGPGDWVLIHAGFAMDKLDEQRARRQMAALREYTGGPPARDADGES